MFSLREFDFAQEHLDRFRAHPGHEFFAVLFLRFAIFHLGQELRFRERRVARIDHDVVLVIDDALELARAHVEHQAKPRRHAFVEPDVRDRHSQLDVAHALTTHARERHFDAATVADHALVLDALVFSAGAFPVTRRTENAFAKQAALFRLEGAVVDRLRILDFALAPGTHRVAGSDADGDLIETDGAFFAHQFTPGMFVHNESSSSKFGKWLGNVLEETGRLAADFDVEA